MKEGRWVKPEGMIIPEYRERYQCSECGAIMMREWRRHRPVKTRFCPDCGARMENGDERVRELKEDLEKLPAVQPEPPWIPCSKKLPEMHEVGPMMKLLGIKEESKRVEISVKIGGVSLVISGWLRDGKWYSPDLNAYVARKMNYEVTAWMPLPEPYEGGAE